MYFLKIRLLGTLLLAGTLSACAAAGTGGTESAPAEREAGGRYRVLIPTLQGAEGERVAAELRERVAEMATHTALPRREMQRAMGQYKLSALDEVTARQLAQQLGVENVFWATIEQAGGGLEADARFIDVRSGDEIPIENVRGTNAEALAQALFVALESRIQGVRQAAFCNDYLSSQQFERALETCTQALAVVPESRSALYGQATALLNLERPAEALPLYQKLLELDPAHQDALLGAGLAASRLNQGELAQGFYRRYMELNPGNLQVRLTVANDIARTGDYVSAFRMLEEVRTENEGNADFMKYLFSIATAAGQRVQEEQGREAARPIFEVAMQAYNASYGTGTGELDVASLRQAIAVNTALGNAPQALALSRQAVERFDTVPALWSQYASVLGESGQHAEAARALSRVIELDPDYENAYIRRALAYRQAGNRQAMLADLQRAAERGNREEVAKVLYASGGEALRAERFPEAAGLLEMASGYASGNLKSEVNFFWGYSLYKQAEAIARANTQGSATQARRALPLFQRARELVRGSSHANAGQVLQATEQYIANQEAIIKAAGG